MFMSSKYLRVTIISRYIFLRFWFMAHFAHTNICNLYANVVKGPQILMFGNSHKASTKILHFGPIIKFFFFFYLICVPAKNSHLKAHYFIHLLLT